jgi:hypothetical protein
MFVLIGTRTDHEYGYGGWTGVTLDVEDHLALFDTKKQAEKYAEDSELAAAKKPYFRAAVWRSVYRFKKSSLLRGYDSYHIEELVEDELPRNPILSK